MDADNSPLDVLTPQEIAHEPDGLDSKTTPALGREDDDGDRLGRL
jgi:hypothetical protein